MNVGGGWTLIARAMMAGQHLQVDSQRFSLERRWTEDLSKTLKQEAASGPGEQI